MHASWSKNKISPLKCYGFPFEFFYFLEKGQDLHFKLLFRFPISCLGKEEEELRHRFRKVKPGKKPSV